MRRIMLAALAAAILFVPHAFARQPLPVLAGTAQIEDILADLGQDRIEVKTIVPAAACPGHYDLKPSDVANLAMTKLVVLHEWQAGQAGIQAALAAVSGGEAKTRGAAVPGNWMVPDTQIQATMELADFLIDLDPFGADAYRAKAKARIEMVRAAAARLKSRADGLGAPDIKVVCDVMQRPFLAWLGFAVAADYGRFEETSPEALARVASAAKAARARLVLDNMQSGSGSGAPLAGEIGAGHAVLSNFPGGYPDAPGWEKTVNKNFDLIAAALKR
jgi:zinc transport system substrate-binding protein